MVCSKCGYAVSRGQTSCVYCGTKVVYDAAKNDNTAKRTTSAFAKQLKAAQPDDQAVRTSILAEKAEPQSAPKSADTLSTPKTSPFLAAKQPQASTAAPGVQQPAAKPQIVAPYAFRPMYSAFDPNSEDSPFVRKPLVIESDDEPDTQEDKTVSQISEEETADIVSEEEPATEVSVEESPKKKFGLPVAALTLVFVSLAIFVFSYF